MAGSDASARDAVIRHTQTRRDFPVLRPGQRYATITDQISAIVLQKTPRGWILGFFLFFSLTLVFLYGVVYLFAVGVGAMGINIPVAWGFPIINTVWWIGIGHAGTLISAILLLLRQDWRASINRFAEAMTIFAAGIAAMWPILHLGRPWFFYWLLPMPVTHMPWPQWRSPLVWDFFAIATYLMLSLVFWYMGLMPDLATLRDRAKSRAAQVVYAILALGWRGSAKHWKRYQTAYLILAAFAAPLVVSVHSVVSLDFTIAIVPGYHSTVFPPYFVAGALYSGFCMVLTIAIPLRAAFGLHDFITMRHIDNCAKLLLAAGHIVAYGYVLELFFAWYSGDEFHRHMMLNRMFGAYAWTFWAMLALNVGLLQLLWLRRVRTSLPVLFALSLLINAGMWIERYVITVTSLTEGFLPAAWGEVGATWLDYTLLVGSIGFFFALLFLFIRVLPLITIFEVRELLHDRKEAS
jgi:molybdopterin-containing oxidoreductase family membrane subunit